MVDVHEGAAHGARAKIYQAALRLFAERGAGAVSVSELADAAGIARGTIYNNIENPETLFTDLAGELAGEMIARVEATMIDVEDPAARLATGLRLFIRRAHEEPDWGRFIIRFALSHAALQQMMDQPPARDIARAIEAGRFKPDVGDVNALLSLLVGALLASMNAVVSGHQAWREAGANTARLFLRAAGMRAAEAKRIAEVDLPPLAPPRKRARPVSKGKRS